MIVVVKRPASSSGVGTMKNVLKPALDARALVVEEQEGLVLARSGPLIDAAELLLVQLGLLRVGGSKKFLASSASFRPKQNKAPWNWFVPDLLTRLIWLALKPYSAE